MSLVYSRSIVFTTLLMEIEVMLHWQWVCGSNSSKKYIANQENINKYCRDSQKNTFLDHSYEYLISVEFQEMNDVIIPKLNFI